MSLSQSFIKLLFEAFLQTFKFSCDDFYHFACGNYIETHKLPNNTHVVDEIDKMREKLESELNETFYSEIQDSEIEALKLSRKLFRSCMDLGKKFNDSDKQPGVGSP